MKESAIEQAWRLQFERDGGMLKKIVPVHWLGAPDRVGLLCGVPAFFIEFKRDGKDPTEQQLRRHRELRQRGHIVVFIDSSLAVLQHYLFLRSILDLWPAEDPRWENSLHVNFIAAAPPPSNRNLALRR